MGETNLKNSVMRHLNSIPRSWWYKTSDRFHAGIPDIIGFIDGVPHAFELKFGDNTPTQLQLHTLIDMCMAGAIVGVAYTLDDVKSIIQEGQNWEKEKQRAELIRRYQISRN